MQSSLHYRGELASNGTPSQKHALRENFHRQLTRLWQQEPLKGYVESMNQIARAGPNPIVVTQGKFSFVPLIASRSSAVAELEIMLLRPEPPGRLITQGGDIDNRLKTELVINVTTKLIVFGVGNTHLA